MAKLLRLANIEKSYYITRTTKQDVLKGINAELDKGEMVALVGESGCGKSTLINILGGLDSEYTGSVVIKGKYIRDFTETEMDDYRKKRVGLIFQNYNLISHMTILENVEIAMQMSDIDPKIRKERAMDLLKMAGLDQYAKKLPSQLSGGQQQRVAIARALANNPSIILADEPTGALDKESAEIIMSILKKIVESGKLVILVTHSHLVADQCSRIIEIDDGKIISDQVNYMITIKGEYEKVIMPKPIKTKDIAKLSYRNIKQKLSRNLFVSVGMSIGIAAIVLILALGLGLRLYIKEVYEDNLTSKLITVSKANYDLIYDLEIERILDLDGVESIIYSSMIETASFTYIDTEKSISYLSEFDNDLYPNLLYGNYPVQSGSVMINLKFASMISEESVIAAVGQNILISYYGTTSSYVISGIYDDLSENSTSTNAYVASGDIYNRFGEDLITNLIYVMLDDVTYINTVIDDMNSLRLHTYQENNSAQELISYIDLGTKVLSGVGFISMIVAAIMIFVVLYISVTERTKEIGILRAIGAQKKDIRKMFIFEATILGVAGGVIGVIFTLVVTIVTNTITNISLDAILISYHLPYYALGIMLSVIVSILAGIAPSMKASELDPVDALRYE
ncbi:MAG: ATP-binding cassette domain-containing protein [Firmicutes bacterium]|nr:ATP-binding cassette domain-containing protein [Bacillota bacterium]